jgi:hypothetical protein
MYGREKWDEIRRGKGGKGIQVVPNGDLKKHSGSREFLIGFFQARSVRFPTTNIKFLN